MDTVKKRTVIDRYLDAYNRLDVEQMMNVIHPDIQFMNISDGEVTARASGSIEFRSLAEESKRRFWWRRQRVLKYDLSEDGSSIEVDYIGVFAADLPDGMKAGKTIRLKGRSDFVFRDGKIYRLTDYS